MKRIKLTIIALVLLNASAVWWASASAQQLNGNIPQLEAQSASAPNDAKLLAQLGWAYFYEARQGNAELLDKAIRTFERSGRLAPNELATQRGLGIAYFLKTAFLARAKASGPEINTAFDQTLTAFERAVARFPDDPLLVSAHGSAQVIYGATRNRFEEIKKGLDAMNRAVKQDSKGVHARLFRGFTTINMPPAFRDGAVVVEDLNAILKSGYNDQAAGVLHILLGDFYLETKDADKARAEYQLAVKAKSTAADEARARLAMLAEGKNDAEAVRRYRNNLLNCAVCHQQ